MQAHSEGQVLKNHIQKVCYGQGLPFHIHQYEPDGNFLLANGPFVQGLGSNKHNCLLLKDNPQPLPP